jgi:hypothetical protein
VFYVKHEKNGDDPPFVGEFLPGHFLTAEGGENAEQRTPS